MPARHHFLLLFAVVAAPFAASAERTCEQSEPMITGSPQERYAASVQHQVCETAAGGVAAAVTVYVGDRETPMQGQRVAAIAVPRTREEWPRVVWRSESSLEVWVPNFAQVLEIRTQYEGIAVALRYCADDAEARTRVAQHQLDMQQWMAATTRWNELRQQEPAAAGQRPSRPPEPKVVQRACTDAELRAGA